MDYLKTLNRICDILRLDKTKKEILKNFEDQGEAICESSLEKCLFVLRNFFDAPIIYNSDSRTYFLENYNFKKTLVDIL